MVRKRDRFWEYAEDLKNHEDLKNRFKCNFCQKGFCGGISRVKSHLSGVKGRDIEICPKVPSNVQAAAFEAIGSPCKKGKSIAVSVNGDEGGINPTLTTYKDDKNAIDKKFVRFFLLNNIAEDVFQSQAFIDFVKGVGEFGAGYELPNFTLQAQLVSDYDKEIMGYIRNVKESWIVTGCTLMVDIEKRNEHAFVNFFAYCPRGVVFLKSSLISGDEMIDILSSTIDEIGTNHVTQVIINDDKYFELLEDKLDDKYPHLKIHKCAIHGIQSLIMDIHNEVGWVRRITLVGKLIVSYIQKRGIKLAFQIQRNTTCKELEHLYLARFAPNFLLLHSILEFETELRALQLLEASSDWERLDFNMRKLAKWVGNVIESTAFWTLGKEVLHIVDTLFQVLHLLSVDAPTSGYFYEAMKRAGKAIRRCFEKDQAKYNPIWELFAATLHEIISEIHVYAAFLNPANMCDENFEDLDMADGIRISVEENLVAASEKDAFLEQVQLYRVEFSFLFTTTALEMSKTLHPRKWWHYFGERLPVLKKYAIRILSQPCNSSCNIKKLEAVTDHDYTRINILMMEKFSEQKAHDLVPTDFGKLTGLPEYVNNQDLEDFPDLESIYEKNHTIEDPLRLWLDNEDDFKHWNVTP